MLEKLQGMYRQAVIDNNIKLQRELSVVIDNMVNARPGKPAKDKAAKPANTTGFKAGSFAYRWVMFNRRADMANVETVKKIDAFFILNGDASGGAEGVIRRAYALLLLNGNGAEEYKTKYNEQAVFPLDYVTAVRTTAWITDRLSHAGLITKADHEAYKADIAARLAFLK